MKLTFAGGAKSVTGANYLLETTESRVLIDCGLRQGSRVGEEENYADFPYAPYSIDALLITHAHIDHVGRSPRLYKMGFRGKVFSTEPTKEFAEELLKDSQDLLSREAASMGKEALYRDEDVDGLMGLWKTNGYHKEILFKDNLKEDMMDAIKYEIEKIVKFHTSDNLKENWNLKEISEIAKTMFGTSEGLEKKLAEFGSSQEISDYLFSLSQEIYQQKD